MKCTAATLLAPALLVAACSGPAPERIEIERTKGSLYLSSVSLNGTQFGGSSLYSANLSSPTTLPSNDTLDREGIYSGVSTNGPSTDGASVDYAALDFALLEQVGEPIKAELEDGRSVELRIDDASATDDGLVLYDVVARLPGGEWSALCGADVAAIAVPNLWSTSTRTGNPGGKFYEQDKFTFACRGSTVAKCSEMGYTGEDPLWDVAAFHEACVRMLRADYCGDGTSHTDAGVELAYWDALDIQSRTQSEWTFEASWSDDGATCINATRLPMNDRPDCVERLMRKSCDGSDTDYNYFMLRSAFDGGDVSAAMSAPASSPSTTAEKKKKKK